MITIDLGTIERYNPNTNSFEYEHIGEKRFEHSLLSISKWESKYCVPYLHAKKLTEEQSIDYYRFMCLDGDLPKDAIDYDVSLLLSQYINQPHTATKLQNDDSKVSTKVITSELIYATMSIANVPFECETWNYNRLVTLLGVISAMNSEPKKKTTQEIYAENARINAERKAKYNTRG